MPEERSAATPQKENVAGAAKKRNKTQKDPEQGGLRDKIVKNARDLLFILVIIVCVALIGISVTMLSEYNEELKNQAATAAEALAAEIRLPMERTVNTYTSRVYHVAQAVRGCDSEVGAVNFLEGLNTSSDEAYRSIYLVRYCREGKIYSLGGSDITADEDKYVQAAAGKTSPYMIGTVKDNENNKQAIAFYAPVNDYPYMDGVVLYYPVDLLKTTVAVNDALGDAVGSAELLALYNASGTMLDVAQNKANVFESNYNLVEQMPLLCGDETQGLAVAGTIISHGGGVFNLKFNYDDYVLFLTQIDGNSNVGYVGLYRSEDLYTSGYEFVNTILGAMVLLGIILLAFSLYFIISRHITEKRLYRSKAYNEELDCLTRFGFEDQLTDIVARNPGSQFAVVVVSIFHFKYIREQIGIVPSQAALAYVKTLIKKLKGGEEIFGYEHEGRFLMLVHYRDRENMTDRLNQLYSLGSRYKGLHDFNLRLQYGICEIDRDANQRAHVLVDEALQAALAADLNNVQRYRFFDENLRRATADNAEIETRMETALENNEFYLFFQPKFNIEKNFQEGCETLSRWLVPDESGKLVPFARPDVFIPVFENNGFIVRFDRYVYESVCKYIVDTVAAGRPLFPISVNVSRVTAMQADFVDTYAKIKKKYGIADNFLMLEFTESFANENYEEMLDIVNRLHTAGFKCSVDDFGSGYSSYNCIKSLPMDEIKLDKFFLSKGLSNERDEAIISSVISVAKKVGMKVTQEGIETEEEMLRLRRLGCQVIQGYYYSKPLSVEDYIAFTTNEANNRMDVLMHR